MTSFGCFDEIEGQYIRPKSLKGLTLSLKSHPCKGHAIHIIFVHFEQFCDPVYGGTTTLEKSILMRIEIIDRTLCTDHNL